MISEFVREQQRYTQQGLSELLRCSAEQAVPLLRRLMEFGVLKAVKASAAQKDLSDLADEDIEVAGITAGADEYLYVFTFVGVIVVGGCVLKCYPKYLKSACRPTAELRHVLKVLEKYAAREQIVRTHSDSSETDAFNLLAVLLFFLRDYYENGLYTSTEEVIESNGPGEIIWDKTIHETLALLHANRPYYVELRTKKRVADNRDYFRRLHAWILTRASAELRDAGLLDLFEITGVDLSDETLDDFGEQEYIIYRIEKELAAQFNTRKLLLLQTIRAYITQGKSLYDVDDLTLFGTNSFNLVWERVCADILDNRLKSPLEDLPLPVPLRPEYDKKMKLIDLIEKPLWSVTGKTAADTLIPDLIMIAGDRFVIFDAKYYCARLEPGEAPKGHPGIESVTKQYLYQLAYQKFIADHRFSTVKNCFLLPTENNEIENRGEVSLEMLSGLGLQNIQVRFLPAEMAYDFYLSGRTMDIDLLQL